MPVAGLSVTVFLVVLAAAALHATWNALVKGGADKALAMSAVIMGQGLFGLVCLAFVGLPAAPGWTLILLSIGLHLGYQFFLLGAYRIGDLTQVYPIARGTAPMLVAGFSVVVLGVDLSFLEIAGVMVIGAGIMSLVLVRRHDGRQNPRAALLAFLTGAFIAAYSLADGYGARLAGTALGFYGVVALGNAVLFAAIAGVARPRLLRDLPRAARLLLVGGGASFLAYALVVWAFTQAPIALVTALRETSIIFALLIGTVIFRERLDIPKLVATMLTICGAALLRLSRG
jgi:drug/metabolite transporter (DMT)-like permease